MDRREAVSALLAGLAAPLAALAQPSRRIYRIVVLDDGPSLARGDIWAAFRRRLRELGLVDGSNLFVDVRYGDNSPEKFKTMVAEAMEAKPDVIVTPGTTATLTVMRAASGIPVIFSGVGDPLSSGIVKSLARPGGNVTGVSIQAPEFAYKGLELLHALAPRARTVAYLTNPSSKSAIASFARLEPGASAFGKSIVMLNCLGRSALEQAFARVKRDRIQALLVSGIGTVLSHMEEIVEFAAREKLPSVYGRDEYVRLGGLASFGYDRAIARARAAEMVQKVLNGTKPAEMPVEQVSRFQTVLNIKTARALAIKIPEAVRLKADEILE